MIFIDTNHSFVQRNIYTYIIYIHYIHIQILMENSESNISYPET